MNIMKDHALKSGVIMGVLGILISLVVYIIDPLLMIKWWFSLFSLVLFIALVTYYGMQYRELTGGYLSFKKAYIYSFLAFVVAGILGLVFNIFLFHVIDPEGNRLAFFSPTISKEKYYKVKKS